MASTDKTQVELLKELEALRAQVAELERSEAKRRRAEEAEREQRALADALRDVAAALNGTLQLDEVLDLILVNIERVVPHDATNIMLVKDGIAQVVCCRGYTERGLEEDLLGLRLRYADLPDMLRMVEVGQPTLIMDTQTDPNWVEMPESRWVRSLAGVPIRLKGHVIGIINVDSGTPGFFTTEHIERLQAFADQAATAIHNARLYEEVQRHAARLITLREIDRGILAARSPEGIAQATMSHIRELVPCKGVSTVLFDLEAEQATVLSTLIDGESRYEVGTRHTFRLPDVPAEFHQGAVHLVEDTRTISDPVSVDDILQTEGLLSYAAIPLIVRDKLIGSLYLASEKPGTFDPEHVEVAHEVADQLAVAIQQTRLREQVQRHSAQLEALQRVTLDITAQLDLDTLLHTIIESALRLLDARGGGIFLCRPERGVIEQVAGAGVNGRTLDRLAFRRGEGLTGKVWQSDKPLIVDNYTEWEGRSPAVEGTSWEAMLGVPIRWQAETLGVIVAEAPLSRPFSDDDAHLLSLFGTQAAIAIRNAQLYDATHRQAVELEQRVGERTAELQAANEQLLAEIAERKRVEEALREERDFTSAVLDVAGALVVVLDTKGRIVRFNQACEETTGYPFEEIKDMPFWETLLLPEEREAVKAVFMELRTGKFPNRYENYWVARDGSRRLIAWSNTALPGADGVVKYIIGTGIDVTERRQAEEALRESEEKYRRLVESTVDWVWAIDTDGCHTFSNEAVKHILGYEPDEIIGCSSFPLIHPEDQENIREMVRESAEQKIGWKDVAIRWVAKDGSTRFFESTAQPILDANGNLIGFSGIDRDVTERMEAEAALRASEARYRSLFDGMPIGLYRTTPEGQFADANPAMVDILGYPDRETLLATNVLELFVDPTERERGRELTEREGGVRNHELQIRRYDGAIVWVSVNSSSVRDSDGRVMYYEGALKDITERKQAEQAESEQRALAEALRDSAAALSSTLDFDEVLEHILTNVERVVPHAWADVMLIERGVARVVRGRSTYPEAKIKVADTSWAVDETPNFRQMATTGKAHVVPDTRKFPGWIDTPETHWIRSYVGAPILMEGDVIGFINLSSIIPDFYTPTHAEHLQAFADQSGVAIRNARLYEAIQHRKRYLETLHRVSRRVVPERNQKKLMQAVVDGLAGEFGYPIATILLGNNTTRELEIAAMANGTAEILKVGADYRQSYDVGTLGWVMLYGQPRLVNDTDQAPDYITGGGTRTGSELSVPIRHEGKVIGVLSVASMEKGSFNELDQEALLELADDLALNLENLALNEQLEQAAAEAERHRLARDLHDAVSQTIWSATLTAEVLPRVWERDPEEGMRRLETLHRSMRGALAEMRALLMELRPATLGSVELETLLRQLATTITNRTGVPVKVRMKGQVSLPPDVKIGLYRIAQESMNNIAKHAQASQVTVSLLSRPEGMELTISDDGRGFDPDRVPAGHLGLDIIRERAEAIGAKLTITSRVGSGTQIAVAWTGIQGKEGP